MPKKRDYLRIIDQTPPVTGGGGVIQQATAIAPPVVGVIPAPTNLTLVSTAIARSSQAPMAIVNLSWNAPPRIQPDYYIIEYSKSSSFTNPTRERAYELTASVIVDTSSTYYFRVQAVYRNAISDWTSTLTVNTPSDTTAPADVSSAVAVFENGNVVITWTEPAATNETYKDARIRIWNPAKSVLYATYHTRGGSFIWHEDENMRLAGGVTSVAVDVTSRGWNNIYGTQKNLSAGMANPIPPSGLSTDFTTGDLVISWTNPAGIPYRDIEVKLYESSSKLTNYKTYYVSGNTVTFSREDNLAATSNSPDISIYIEVKTRGWLGLMSSAINTTATHVALAAVTSLTATFNAGDLLVTWTNPAAPYKDIEIKVYESASKSTTYKTYYVMGNSIVFSQADNYAINGSTPDTSLYVEVKTRSRLDVLSTAANASATLAAPNPVTSVVTDFTTGDLEIRWTNPTNTAYRDVEVKLYESASKATNYKTYYLNGNRVTFTVEDNFAVTGNNPDISIYYEILVRSWLGVTSTTVTGTATHTAPSAPTNVTHTWSGDDGTYPSSVTLKWDVVPTAKNYRISFDGLTEYITNSPTFEYTYSTNVSDHIGSGNFGDHSLTYFIYAQSYLNLSGTAANATITNAAPPGSSVITVTAVAGFSTVGAYISLTKPIQDIYYYIYELHDGTSVVQTLNTASQVISFEGVASGTYTVRVKAVDLFNRQGSQVNSGSLTIDALTIAELRKEAIYLDSQGRTSPTLDVLKDDLTTPTITYNETGAGAYNWTRIERPTMDRYGVVTYYSAVATEVYFGVSEDNVTYTWYSGSVTDKGSGRYVLTKKNNETDARVDRVFLSAATRYSLQIPELKDGRFVRMYHRYNSAGTYTIAELYARRIVQSDDIEAESIRAINIAAGAVVADKISVTTLGAIQTSTGTLIINTGGYLRSGQTAYDTGTGFYLGNDAGTPKFSIGNSAGHRLTWDGTILSIRSGASNSILLDANGIVMSSGGIIRAGQTAYDTGTGFYLGNDSGTPKFSVGNASGDKLTWNGTVLAVTGQFNLSGVATIGTSGGLYQGTGTFASPTTGLKIFNSGGIGKIATYNAGTEQVVIDTDGKLKAGAGTLLLDSTGIYINMTQSGSYEDKGSFKFKSSDTKTRFIITALEGASTIFNRIFADGQGSTFLQGSINKNQDLFIAAQSPATYSSAITLEVVSGTIGASLDFSADSNGTTAVQLVSDTCGLNVGDVNNVTSDAGPGEVKAFNFTARSTNTDKVVLVDRNDYSNGTGRIQYIHFRAKNPDGVDTYNSASVVANVTAQAGITIPKSTISIYTTDNTAGYGERFKIDEIGTTFIYTTTNDKAILTDVNSYVNGTARTVNLHFKARNPDGALTHTSASIVATITPNSGITIPQSYLTFHTKDNSLGYGEVMRLSAGRTVLIGRTSGLTGSGELDVNGRARADSWETSAGIKWKFTGGYTGTVLAIAGYVTIDVDGVSRKVAIVA